MCYGTRPQVIKASALRRALAPGWRLLSVDTGQHYDFALNALLYQQLGVAPPDHFLEVGSAGHAEQTAAVLTRTAALLEAARPRLVIVIGDTNSTLGAALAAAQLRVPVAHVEAGLRATDHQMAEEINRRATDAIGELLCTPSAQATERLRRERPEATVVQTGDVARDVLQHVLAEDLPPTGGSTRPYVFATLHRAELTDHPEVLADVIGALARLPLPVKLAAHPRTRLALDRLGLEAHGSLEIIPPVGYLESIGFTRDASLVVTDSGGVQREAYWLGVPCITIRRETEWTETLALGANHLVAPEHASRDLAAAVQARLEDKPGRPWDRDAYGTGDAAERTASAIRALLER